jgi:hypothetical protein
MYVSAKQNIEQQKWVGNDQYAIGHPHTQSLSPSTPIERLLIVIV